LWSVVGELQVEVHKKQDVVVKVVVKVAGEFKAQLVKKWKVVVMLGGEFQMEVGRNRMWQ
jgi:hypothetical protein